MKKIALFVVCIMLATSFMSIFSIECTAATSNPEAPNPEAPNPIPGIAITTVTGLFFNVQVSTFMVSFYALRIHYWTTGLFRHERGIINFKSCTGGAIILPYLLLRMGPFHNIVYGTFTFLGNIHYIRIGFGQGFTNTLLTT